MSNSQQKQNIPAHSNQKNKSPNLNSNRKSEIDQHSATKSIVPQKQSFLSKFKDKHSIISKEGLISLLQNKKIQIKSVEKTQNSKVKDQLSDILKDKSSGIFKKSKDDSNAQLNSVKIKQIQQEKIGQIIKSRSLRKNSDSSVSKSVQLYEIPKKLPSLHKIPSYTHSLRKKDAATPVSDIYSVARTQNIAGNSNIVKKAPLKIQATSNKKNEILFQLDKYAMDHLDFLQKFQERMKAKDR